MPQQWIELENGWLLSIPSGSWLALLDNGNAIKLKCPDGNLYLVLAAINTQGMIMKDAFQFFKNQIAEGKPLIRQPHTVKP